MYHLRRKVHFVIMTSVFDTPAIINTIYDLKGSMVGREASEKERSSGGVLKDKDLINDNCKLHLGTKKAQFMAQLEKDAQFLAQLNIMDYSLLVGIHDRRQRPKAVVPQLIHGHDGEDSPIGPSGSGGGSAGGHNISTNSMHPVIQTGHPHHHSPSGSPTTATSSLVYADRRLSTTNDSAAAGATGATPSRGPERTFSVSSKGGHESNLSSSSLDSAQPPLSPSKQVPMEGSSNGSGGGRGAGGDDLAPGQGPPLLPLSSPAVPQARVHSQHSNTPFRRSLHAEAGHAIGLYTAYGGAPGAGPDSPLKDRGASRDLEGAGSGGESGGESDGHGHVRARRHSSHHQHTSQHHPHQRGRRGSHHQQSDRPVTTRHSSHGRSSINADITGTGTGTGESAANGHRRNSSATQSTNGKAPVSGDGAGCGSGGGHGSVTKHPSPTNSEQQGAEAPTLNTAAVEVELELSERATPQQLSSSDHNASGDRRDGALASGVSGKGDGTVSQQDGGGSSDNESSEDGSSVYSESGSESDFGSESGSNDEEEEEYYDLDEGDSDAHSVGASDADATNGSVHMSSLDEGAGVAPVHTHRHHHSVDATAHTGASGAGRHDHARSSSAPIPRRELVVDDGSILHSATSGVLPEVS